MTPRRLMTTDGTVTGLSLFNATPDELSGIHAALRAGLIAGTLRPVIQARYPLSDAAEAHRAVIEDPSAGKVILDA